MQVITNAVQRLGPVLLRLRRVLDLITLCSCDGLIDVGLEVPLDKLTFFNEGGALGPVSRRNLSIATLYLSLWVSFTWLSGFSVFNVFN